MYLHTNSAFFKTSRSNQPPTVPFYCLLSSEQKTRKSWGKYIIFLAPGHDDEHSFLAHIVWDRAVDK